MWEFTGRCHPSVRVVMRGLLFVDGLVVCGFVSGGCEQTRAGG